jgi:hypothetical protein
VIHCPSTTYRNWNFAPNGRSTVACQTPLRVCRNMMSFSRHSLKSPVREILSAHTQEGSSKTTRTCPGIGERFFRIMVLLFHPATGHCSWAATHHKRLNRNRLATRERNKMSCYPINTLFCLRPSTVCVVDRTGTYSIAARWFLIWRVIILLLNGMVTLFIQGAIKTCPKFSIAECHAIVYRHI